MAGGGDRDAVVDRQGLVGLVGIKVSNQQPTQTGEIHFMEGTTEIPTRSRAGLFFLGGA